MAKLHVNWLELEASLKLESVRKRKEGPFTELIVVVTPCFPLKVSQSAEDKNPFVEADDVAIVKVRVFEEVEMDNPEAPEVAKVKDAVWTPLIVVVAVEVAADIRIVPAPFVMKILLPAVSVLAAQPDEEPIKSWPFVGATLMPMPPLEVARAFVRERVEMVVVVSVAWPRLSNLVAPFARRAPEARLRFPVEIFTRPAGVRTMLLVPPFEVMVVVAP